MRITARRQLTSVVALTIVEHKCMRTSILYEHNTENIFMLISHMLREATEASKNQHSTSDHILKNCLKRNSVLADNNKYR